MSQEQSISIIIHNLEQQRIGTLDIMPDQSVGFSENFPQDLQDFTQQAIDQGIEILAEVYDKTTDTRAHYKKVVTSADSEFITPFLEQIERMGYHATLRHPEAEAEIMKYLETFPDDDPEKIAILKNLSDMSYLEQTAILEELKKLNT